MKPRKPTTLIILLFPAFLFAHGITISDYTIGVANGDKPVRATVCISTYERETTTNAYGIYSFALPKSHSIGTVSSYLGHLPIAQKDYLEKNSNLNIDLLSSSVELDKIEVVIPSESNDENVNEDQFCVVEIPITETKKLPGILGETDVLKIVQLIDEFDHFITLFGALNKTLSELKPKTLSVY